MSVERLQVCVSVFEEIGTREGVCEEVGTRCVKRLDGINGSIFVERLGNC